MNMFKEFQENLTKLEMRDQGEGLPDETEMQEVLSQAGLQPPFKNSPFILKAIICSMCYVILELPDSTLT